MIASIDISKYSKYQRSYLHITDEFQISHLHYLHKR